MVATSLSLGHLIIMWWLGRHMRTGKVDMEGGDVGNSDRWGVEEMRGLDKGRKGKC